MRERRGARLRARRRELSRNRRERARGAVPTLTRASGALVQPRHALLAAGLLGAAVLAVTGARYAGWTGQSVDATGKLASEVSTAAVVPRADSWPLRAADAGSSD